MILPATGSVAGTAPLFNAPAAATAYRCLFHRSSNFFSHVLVEDTGKYAITPWIWDIIGNCVGCCNFHLIRDPRGPGIERSPEYAGKCEDIVDLVRKITPPGPDDHRPRMGCCIRPDFRDRIGHGKYNGFFVH